MNSNPRTRGWRERHVQARTRARDTPRLESAPHGSFFRLRAVQEEARRAPFDSSRSTQRRTLPRGGTLVIATLSYALDAGEIRARIERRAWTTRWTRNALRAERNAQRALPRESHNQLCAPIAMGRRLGSAQACRPIVVEHGRVLPRSTYEGTRDGYMVVGPRPRDRTAVRRTRPELNLKFTDNDIARAQMD